MYWHYNKVLFIWYNAARMQIELQHIFNTVTLIFIPTMYNTLGVHRRASAALSAANKFNKIYFINRTRISILCSRAVLHRVTLPLRGSSLLPAPRRSSRLLAALRRVIDRLTCHVTWVHWAFCIGLRSARSGYFIF